MNTILKKDIEEIANCSIIDWNKFENKNILIYNVKDGKTKKENL